MIRWCEMYADSTGRLLVEFWAILHGRPARVSQFASASLYPDLDFQPFGDSIDHLRVVS